MFYKMGLIGLLVSFVGIISFAQPDPAPVPVIFDTDIGPDYDDAGAITILHALEENGEAKILATVASNKYEGIAGIIQVFNTYWHRPNIPIGVPKKEGVTLRDSQHWTDSLLENYPHEIKSNEEVPDAVTVYRKVLAEQPDTSVTIVTVGFLTNLSYLLKSQGDDYSPLNGTALVKKKVKKLVSMAGAFPSGREFNVLQDASSSKYVFEHWPTPVLFSGFEIGAKIKSGLLLIHNEKIQNNPAKDAFRICIPMNPQDSAGRMSWDEATVLVAVRGYERWFTLQEGRIVIEPDGSNSWNNEGGKQHYLIQKEDPKEIEQVINHLMMQQPKDR